MYTYPAEKKLTEYLWVDDHFIKQLCVALDDYKVHEWKLKPNTVEIISELCRTSFYLTEKDKIYTYDFLDTRITPTIKDGKIRALEVVVVDKDTDKIYVYCLLTATIDGWTYKDMIPNPVLQIMLR